jgi:hypothetical protein
MLNITQAFSSTDVFGVWISSVTTNFTGDVSLTLIFALIGLLLLMTIFRMPDILMVLLLVAPLILFSTLSEVGDTFNIFIGLLILYLSAVVWSLFPGK